MVKFRITFTLGCLVAFGCHHKPPAHPEDHAATETSHTRSGPDTTEGPTTQQGGSTSSDDERPLAVDPVYFEFDSSELSEHGRTELTNVASWMERHTATRLRIEGHTDDRGTTEYNLGLGDRRAHVIEDYLVRLGIDAGRIDTISYGEEQPAADGDDETAWAQNRRGVLDVKH